MGYRKIMTLVPNITLGSEVYTDVYKQVCQDGRLWHYTSLLCPSGTSSKHLAIHSSVKSKRHVTMRHSNCWGEEMPSVSHTWASFHEKKLISSKITVKDLVKLLEKQIQHLSGAKQALYRHNFKGFSTTNSHNYRLHLHRGTCFFN